VAPLAVHFYATRIKGISNRDAMYEPGQVVRGTEGGGNKARLAWRSVTDDGNEARAPLGILANPKALP